MSAAADVLLKLFSEWNEQGVEFALLGGAAPVPLDPSSDVDVVFAADPRLYVDPILERMQAQGRVLIVHHLHYEVPHGFYYVVKCFGDPDEFLRLDCLFDPHGLGRYHVSTAYLLQDRQRESWGTRADDRRNALYLLVKGAVKGTLSDEKRRLLDRAITADPDAFWPEVARWFGPRGRGRVERLLAAGNNAADLAGLRRALEWRFRTRHPVRWLAGRALSLLRQLRRAIQPTGLFVVMLGPDGSGKSTVADLVLDDLQRVFRRSWRFHWRPGLLPKLSRARHEGAAAAPPPARSHYTGVVSLARFAYYWLDFVLGYWLIIYPRRAATGLIVGERYFLDVLVMPERYGFAVPRWLMRLAACLVPKPDLTVLLADDPEAIHARKPELSAARIGALTAAYEAELAHWGDSRILPVGDGAEAAAARLAALIVAARAGKTARRIGAESSWRAFPAAASAKVWVGEGDTLRRALALYRPASRAGRAARACALACPDALAARLWRGRPEAVLAARLDRLAGAVRARLGDPALAVSVSPGTPGRHRKMTAQAAGPAGIAVYAKAAESPAIAALIEAEAAMLAWLAERDLGPAAVPALIGLERSGDLTLLLQGPPPAPARPRPLDPDHKDAAVLAALMALDRGTLPLDEVFAAWPADEALADVTREVRAALAVALPAGRAAVAAGHGDYAPWNTLDLGGGRLFVFDWEYGRREAPLLGDLFHRLLMPARLVRRVPAARLVARLLAVADDPVLGPVVAASGIPRAELPGYLLLYLLGMAHREQAQAGAVSPYLRACLRAGLAAIGGARRPRNVLVAAYACEPDKGSEPGVGWHVCQAISRAHKTWVITKDNNREPIERALAARPNPNLHFAYVGLPRWLTFWKKGPRGVRLYYYLWQFAAWRAARRLGREVDFDLAHHVTFVNDWMFSFLALLPHPFVWGPIGSNPKIPAALAPGLRALTVDRLRGAVQAACRAADPLYWLCAVRASLIVGINPQVGRTFPLSLLARGKFLSHPAIGVEAGLSPAGGGEPARRGLRVLSMGQFIRVKGFHLAIRAFARFAAADPGASLTVVGDGPEKRRLAALARALGIEARVTFRAWLPRDEALREMGRADIFLHPSFEGGGMVVLEAMAHGLPVVCLDYGGAGEMVGGIGGVCVPAGTLEATVAGLAEALTALAGDGETRRRLGAAAHERVTARYLWEGRAEAIGDWYTGALRG